MPPARQQEIAALGGRAAHAQGKAYRWTSEQASIAGRKGGQARKRKQRLAEGIPR